MSKIKIAFVETNCKINGPINQTFNIIQNMDRTIFEPVLITVWPEDKDNSMMDDYKKLNIPIFSAYISKKKSIFLGKIYITKILSEVKPDIVQGVGMPPYRITLGYRDTVHFVTLRNYCYEDYPDYYGKIVGMIMAFLDIRLIKKCVKKGKPIVTCSKSLTNIYKEKENIAISYIQNGVDVSRYTKKNISCVSEIRNKLELPQGKIIFIYSGSFINRKNQKEAIMAFLNMKKRKDAILLLLGDGTDFKSLKEEYGMNTDILFKGKVFNMNEYLHASDIYLSTSKSEGLPNGVLEAMACGLPVILSDIPQHMEVLEENLECGHSYMLGNVQNLANRMDYMMEEDLRVMGESSYNVVMDNFTSESMSKKYQKEYLKMI